MDNISKFLFSTLVAAAAMTSTAWAEGSETTQGSLTKDGDNIEIIGDYTNTEDILTGIGGSLYIGLDVSENREYPDTKFTVADGTTVFGGSIYQRTGTQVLVNGTLTSGAWQIKDSEATIDVGGKMVQTTTGVHLRNSEKGSSLTVKGELEFNRGANNLVDTVTLDIDSGSKLLVDGGKITSTYSSSHATDAGDQYVIDVNAGGTFEVKNGSVNVNQVINNGTFTVAGTSTLNIEAVSGNEVVLLDGAIIKDSTVGGDAYVAGNVTFRGKNEFNNVYDFGTYYDGANAKWSVEAGGSLRLTHTVGNAYGLGYGDNVSINGLLEEGAAVKTDRSNLTESDVSFYAEKGIRLSTSKGNDSSDGSFFTVSNAYVVIGKSGSFSNSKTNGVFTLDFNNSVVDAAQIFFSESDDKITLSFDGSDIQTGIFMTADKDSVYSVNNSKMVITATGTDRYNGNGGTLTISGSEIELTANGKYSNSGTLIITNSTFKAVNVENTGAITLVNSTLKITGTLTNTGTITMDMNSKIVDANGASAGLSLGENATIEVSDANVAINVAAAGVIFKGVKELATNGITTDAIANVKVLGAWDFDITANNNEVTVTVDVGELSAADQANLAILHKADGAADWTKTEIKGEYKDGKVTFKTNSFSSYAVAIPEPSTFGLLAGLGALALVGARRRRR